MTDLVRDESSDALQTVWPSVCNQKHMDYKYFEVRQISIEYRPCTYVVMHSISMSLPVSVVGDETSLAACDHSPVLHGAHRKSVQGDKVQLWKRVPFSKIIVEKFEALFCDLQREASLFSLTPRCIDPNSSATTITRPSLEVFVVTDDETYEV